MLKWLLGLIYPVCPACDGEGGATTGYYEPEFSECECCNWWLYNEAKVTRVWRWWWWLHRYREWQAERHLDKQIEQWEREHSAE